MKDWAQDAAREICDSFPAETARMQNEFIAEIIRDHANSAGEQYLIVLGNIWRNLVAKVGIL